MNRYFKTLFGLVLLASVSATAAPADQWSQTQANNWYAKQAWPAGCNFSPSTAINQLEMWQADTFDPVTIDRELGWAQDLGFNTVRVFLHNLLWMEDSKGFTKRMEKFLNIADKHHIKVMFVIFDSCWDPFPRLGKQHDPKPFTHNSGWVQSPGQEILKDPAKQDELKVYVQGVIKHFKSDKRIIAWDVFNEPDNLNGSSYNKLELKNKRDLSLALLKKTFAWAREVNPKQPLTSGMWQGNWGNPDKLSATEKLQLENSDIVSFHSYGSLKDLKLCVEHLQRYGRPLICTEYMARPHKSTFDPNLGYMQEQKVGAINWGFVSGKTQTIYPWDSWDKAYTAEPPVWFHDIFRANGDAYRPEEVQYIKSVTQRAAAGTK